MNPESLVRLPLPTNGKPQELPRQPDAERLFRRVRNLLRQYSVRELVEAALPFIWKEQSSRDELQRLRAFSWHVLLLVKWALQDEKTPLDRGDKKNAAVPERLVNMLRQSLFTHAGVFSKGAPNVIAMIRSYMGVQIEYQRQRSYSFVRWPALIAEWPENSVLRRQFRDTLGMEPAAFIDLALALKTALLASPRGIPNTYFSDLKGSNAGDVESMKRLFVRSLAELREELLRASVRPSKTELLEFPYFVRHPILELNGRWLFWDAVVAAKAFERAVHIRMSDLTQEYAKTFSVAFERYVVRLVREAGLQPIGDTDFKKLVGPSKNAEAIVPLGEANLIVEAKMGLFGDSMLLKDDPMFLYQKLLPLRKGMKQGHEVSGRLRTTSSVSGPVAEAKEDFLFIVTSRDLLVSGGPMLKKLIEPQVDLDYFDPASALPLKNTFIMDIQGFETFCMAVKEGRFDPVTKLRAAAEKNEYVGQGSMFFEQWLTADEQPSGLPAVIQEALDSAYTRIAGGFKSLAATAN